MVIKRRMFLAPIIALLLTSMLTAAFNIQPANASSTIYIRVDGSIDPPTAPFFTTDNITYTFTSSINESIVVERSNITVDGNGYTLQGSGIGIGLDLSGIHGVTIKSTNIRSFLIGIGLSESSNNNISGNNIAANNGNAIHFEDSSNNSISRNNITANNGGGIYLFSSLNNSISGNNIRNNTRGIYLSWGSHYSIITGNNIADNVEYGIRLYISSNNTLSGNNIANNEVGVWVEGSVYNEFYHNYFIDNINQTYVEPGYVNIWDKGYPTGGNYWSDYEIKYPNATEIDESDLWDTPYVIDENNIDNYPIIPELLSPTIPLLLMIATSIALMIHQRKLKTTPQIPIQYCARKKGKVKSNR